jgi:hypothetical protein
MVGVALRRHAAGRQCHKHSASAQTRQPILPSHSAIRITLCAAVVILAPKLAVQAPD